MDKNEEQKLFEELSYYTFSHPNIEYFIHQHAVDAFAVQHADADTKIIKYTYGLLGLYLFIEHGFSGKQIQNIHVQLSKDKSNWPKLQQIDTQTEFSISQILNTPKGAERDKKIREWCLIVWENQKNNHALIHEWLVKRGIL